VRHKLQILVLAILAGVIFGLIQLVTIPSVHAEPIQAVSLNQVILTNTQGKYPLGLHLDILEDKQKQWTIHCATQSAIL
jgi:hypothetical protein